MLRDRAVLIVTKYGKIHVLRRCGCICVLLACAMVFASGGFILLALPAAILAGLGAILVVQSFEIQSKREKREKDA